jgi:phospholipase C
MPLRVVSGVAAAVACLLGGCAAGTSPDAATTPPSAVAPATPPRAPGAQHASRPRPAAVPAFSHVVVVIEENHAFNEVIGNANAPYITSLARAGATMTQSFALTHPSQPNYLALFSGSTQGVTSDSCPHTFSAENLGHQLLAAGIGFAAYSDTMPSDGFTGCTSGRYARKHNPWTDFDNVPASVNLRFSRFPTDFSTLPKLSFVIPDLCDDMHDCGVSTGDSWLRTHLGAYATWAAANNSLLLVTFDEDDSSASNQIPTLFSGAHVKPGSYAERITHYTVLRTLETIAGVGCVANSCSASAIADIWS